MSGIDPKEFGEMLSLARQTHEALYRDDTGVIALLQKQNNRVDGLEQWRAKVTGISITLLKVFGFLLPIAGIIAVIIF